MEYLLQQALSKPKTPPKGGTPSAVRELPLDKLEKLGEMLAELKEPSKPE